jgi:uncharacterized membrane protein YkvA (DUF1232 family)
VSAWQLALVVLGGSALTLYLGLLFVLLLLGRREEARAWAGFVPDCVVLFARLLRDTRVSRSQKLLLVGLVAYLSLPFDLVPDFIPVAGQLDDALLVAFSLRAVLRRSGEELLRELWPGPASSLNLICRLVVVGR